MSRPSKQTAKTRPAPLSENLRRARADNAQEIAQDYVELIADLIAADGTARVTNLATRLGVTHVTVNRTLQRLRRQGLVHVEPYRPITLTEAGRKLSEETRKRHQIVCEFLQSLGIPENVAHSDAEGMEHHVSQCTLDAFVGHLERIKR